MKKILALALALCMLFSIAAVAETAAEPTYTYNTYMSVFPTNWNPHQYKTADDGSMLDYISDGFYRWDYNETFDSYARVPNMIVADPVDVTADYVGEEWGIEEGETGKAWKYTLRDNLKWQDGTPITAQTYVDSLERLLNPIAANYRADTVYSGSTVIVNAEDYTKQGTTAPATFASRGATVEGIEDFLAKFGDMPAMINWSYTCGDTYDFEAKAWTGTAVDEVVELPMTVKELWAFYTEPGQPLYEYVYWADDAGKKAYALEECYVNYTFPEMSIDQVGLKALSDTEVVFILKEPLIGFQLKYNLDMSLVHPEMYDKCTTITDGVYTNSYNTSAETSMSYGPYVMTSFQSDKEIKFEKNPYWYGYSLPENEGFYQTTHVDIQYVKEDSTAMEMFLAGKLDSKGLSADYIDEYIDSEHTYLYNGASVFAITINPNLEALTTNQKTAGENINKTILTIKEFRQALSFSLDRDAFNSTCVPGSDSAFALFGNTIVGDPENAIFYRATDAAKQTVVDFWGLTDEVGEGKMYATLDDAIDSITGYNPEMAKEYFNTAYDKAVEAGLMDADDTVQICIGLPSATSVTYNRGYEFLVNNYTEAVKGTKLEGKLTFTRDDTIGNAFGDALRTNKVDMLFLVGWQGSEFDPYGLMEAYLSPNYQYDASVDYSTTDVTIELSTGKMTTDAVSWYKIINGYELMVKNEAGEEVALSLPYSYDATIAADRLLALAALENTMLQNYNFIPTTNDASAGLKGMQINFFMDEEVYPMSYGTSAKYRTFNYTDAEWDAFVASQPGGVINYK